VDVVAQGVLKKEGLSTAFVPRPSYSHAETKAARKGAKLVTLTGGPLVHRDWHCGTCQMKAGQAMTNVKTKAITQRMQHENPTG